MRLLASGLRAVAKKRRVKSTTWVKSVTQNDNIVYREEKRVFQADTDTTPQESPIMFFRNRKQELKTLDITALALEIVAKREDCKRRQLDLHQLELEHQQPPPYNNAVPATRASAPTSGSTPTPDTPSWAWAGVSSIEADIIRIRGLLITSFPKFCTEIDAFRSRYGIDFSHTHQILESRVIIRVLNLYADVKTLHLWETDKNRHKYLRLCEQVIEDWQMWVDNGLSKTKSPFETVRYKELKRKMGW